MNKHLKHFEKVWKESYEMDIELDDFMRFDLCKEVMILEKDNKETIEKSEEEINELKEITRKIFGNKEVIRKQNGLFCYEYKYLIEENIDHISYVKKMKEYNFISARKNKNTKGVRTKEGSKELFCIKIDFLKDCGVEL
jgi:hypothetical protein